MPEFAAKLGSELVVCRLDARGSSIETSTGQQGLVSAIGVGDVQDGSGSYVLLGIDRCGVRVRFSNRLYQSVNSSGFVCESKAKCLIQRLLGLLADHARPLERTSFSLEHDLGDQQTRSCIPHHLFTLIGHELDKIGTDGSTQFFPSGLLVLLAGCGGGSVRDFEVLDGGRDKVSSRSGSDEVEQNSSTGLVHGKTRCEGSDFLQYWETILRSVNCLYVNEPRSRHTVKIALAIILVSSTTSKAVNKTICASAS